jgi:hypothetical protein
LTPKPQLAVISSAVCVFLATIVGGTASAAHRLVGKEKD